MKTLFYGGTILTMAEPLYAEAILVENDRILAVGTQNELQALAGSDVSRIDLHGAVLMPGLIDPHSHFFQTALALLQVSLNGVTSVQEIKDRISDFLKKTPVKDGEWVVARDYDNNLMPDLTNPTLAELDAMTDGQPLVIHHKSGHMGLLNSAALRILGITADTPSPEGGRIETIGGCLTGYLEENAFFEAIRKIPMAGPDAILQAFAGAQDKYASYGITTVQDGMVVEQMLPLYRMLLEKKLLHLDVRLYSAPECYKTTEALLAEYPDNTFLKSGGMKIFLDGSPQGRTAWMRQPYAWEKSYCGYGTMTDEAVEAAFVSAAKEHTQLIAHSNGDNAAEQFLRCLAHAEESHPELHDLRPVIIHGQLIGRDQLPRAAALGAMISFFVAHVYHWGDTHIRNFGMERAKDISPAQSAIANGVRITFHQDTPVIEPDMFETIWCAVCRITRDGTALDPKERVSVLDALKAVTINAAYQYSEENDKGSLEAGKRADFAVIDRDPLKIPAEDLRSIRILETYKNGTCIYHKD